MEKAERNRLTLHELLVKALGCDRVYFSPPSKLVYPCIIYHRENPDVAFADNMGYTETNQWTITVIDRDPDSKIPQRLKGTFLHFYYLSKTREYATDGLYHYVYRLYY